MHEKSQSSSLNTYAWFHCPLAEAFQWTHVRRKALEQQYPFTHENLRSCVAESSACTLANIALKYRLAEVSPSFTIDTVTLNRTTKDSKSSKADYSKVSFQNLQLFQSIPVESGQSRTFFTGAPVWAMDWCPLPLSESQHDQILAVANHSREHLVDPEVTYGEPTVVQFWNCGKLPALPAVEQLGVDVQDSRSDSEGMQVGWLAADKLKQAWPQSRRCVFRQALLVAFFVRNPCINFVRGSP